MPSSGTVSNGGGADQTATETIVSFGNEGNSYPKTRCISLRLSVGMNPGHAVIRIPLNELNERAPAVVGVAGPLTDLQIGTPVIIKAGDGVLLFVGRILEIKGDIGSDFGEVVAVDDRYILEGLPIIGSFWKDESNIVYRHSESFHLNRNNAPNLIWVSGVPCLTYENFGLADGETPPAASAASTEKAAYWDIESTLKALHFIFSDEARSIAGDDYPEYPTLPYGLEWDESFVNGVVDTTAQTPVSRKHREISYQGFNCLQALTTTVQAAGPYAVYIGAGTGKNGFENKVQIVRTRYNGQNAISLIRPTSGLAKDVFIDPMVISGTLRESGANLYTVVAGAGQPVAIETRMLCDPFGDTELDVQIIPAVSDERMQEFNAFVLQLLSIYCDAGECDDSGTTGGV